MIYQREISAGFVLIAEYRITRHGNDGISSRSGVVPDVDIHALRANQCDVDGRNRYTGSNYVDRQRTTLASIGELVVIPDIAGAGELKFVQDN